MTKPNIDETGKVTFPVGKQEEKKETKEVEILDKPVKQEKATRNSRGEVRVVGREEQIKDLYDAIKKLDAEMSELLENNSSEVLDEVLRNTMMDSDALNFLWLMRTTNDMAEHVKSRNGINKDDTNLSHLYINGCLTELEALCRDLVSSATGCGKSCVITRGVITRLMVRKINQERKAVEEKIMKLALIER